MKNLTILLVLKLLCNELLPDMQDEIDSYLQQWLLYHNTSILNLRKTVSFNSSNAISVDDVESVANWWIEDLNVMHCDREAIVSGNWLSQPAWLINQLITLLCDVNSGMHCSIIFCIEKS